MLSQRRFCRLLVQTVETTKKCYRHELCKPAQATFAIQPIRLKRYAYYARSDRTLLEHHDAWVETFSLAGVQEPVESAGYIFAHLLKRKTFTQVPAKSLSYHPTVREVWALEEMCQKRLDHMPVQYVIKEWDFFGTTLRMCPPVFIPRPETERLVQYSLEDIQSRLESACPGPDLKVLEIGCGSGAIVLSLLKNLDTENVSFTAIDAAEHAVDLAKENCRLLGLDKLDKLKIYHQTLGKELDATLSQEGPFDVIVSNPPYIPSFDMCGLAREISCYEDETALHGGVDGMEVICDIMEHSRCLLSENGSLWLEVDTTHPSVLEQNPFDGIRHVRSYRDMFGRMRYCHLRKVTVQ